MPSKGAASPTLLLAPRAWRAVYTGVRSSQHVSRAVWAPGDAAQAGCKADYVVVSMNDVYDDDDDDDGMVQINTANHNKLEQMWTVRRSPCHVPCAVCCPPP